jgi:hypothetical protein
MTRRTQQVLFGMSLAAILLWIAALAVLAVWY